MGRGWAATEWEGWDGKVERSEEKEVNQLKREGQWQRIVVFLIWFNFFIEELSDGATELPTYSIVLDEKSGGHNLELIQTVLLDLFFWGGGLLKLFF